MQLIIERPVVPEFFALLTVAEAAIFEKGSSFYLQGRIFLINTMTLHSRDKMFNNGPSKICGRQPLKNLESYGLLKQTIFLEIFIGCFPQIVIGPFLNK